MVDAAAGDQDARPDHAVLLLGLMGRSLTSDKRKKARALAGGFGRYQNQPPLDSSCSQFLYWALYSEARAWTFCDTPLSHGLAS